MAMKEKEEKSLRGDKKELRHCKRSEERRERRRDTVNRKAMKQVSIRTHTLQHHHHPPKPKRLTNPKQASNTAEKPNRTARKQAFNKQRELQDRSRFPTMFAPF